MSPVKTALVTGGTRGIGESLCRNFAGAGYRVYVNHRSDNPEGRRICDEINAAGGISQPIEFDVGDESSIVRALADSGLKSLDVLVNSAGVVRDNLVLATTDQDWADVLRVNYFGALSTFGFCLPLLRRAQMPVVINVASISGFRGGRGQASYAVSKAALIAWTREMATEFGSGMRFFAVSPGPIATEMIKQAPFYRNPEVFKAIPVRRFGEPVEVANLALVLARFPDAVENGFNWVLDGGMTLSTK